ncbi:MULTISPECIES: helix-turn-helix domain-containing protein [unclassified Streptomyces]|uniref:helix-turn-helix domain-containing protein n=1 Tax=unclassified Streptomyces TaxID=2593676 RepID=UPI00129A849C|nr:helix-turn-helix domain-containing protein [Streptomyces sp. SUK 48]
MTNRQARSAEFGAVLRSAREHAGLTQEQLAGLSTVSIRAIRDLERGRVVRPRRDTVRLLADAMRLGDTGRAALELAADSASVGKALRDVYSPELACPPMPVHTLFGRESELRALADLLGGERERLVTVVGLPGVGKSRLAQEAALQVHRRGDIPVLWLPMDGAGRTPDKAAHRPRTALANWVRPLVSEGGRYDELAAFIADRPTLLVLDGHEVTPATSPALMYLLHSCRRLRILLTSRHPHHVSGGRLLPLAPLPTVLAPGPPPITGPAAISGPAAMSPLPGDSLSARRPAVELMLSYVSHLRPDLLLTDSVIAVVAEICEALDGIPQALEAATSWLLLYSLEQLREMARESPLALVDGAPSLTLGAAAPLGDLLASVRAGLPDRQADLLAAMAPSASSWTVDDAAEALGVPSARAAQDVHALLLHGLIRQFPAGPGGAARPGRFSVLHLVRDLVTGGRPSPEDAAPRLLATGAV